MDNNNQFNDPLKFQQGGNMSNQQSVRNTQNMGGMQGQQGQQGMINNQYQQNMYNQFQQAPYGQQPSYNQQQMQPNMYNQNGFNPYNQPAQPKKKSFLGIILLIGGLVLGFGAIILVTVLLIVGVAAAEKEPISSKDIKSYLNDNNIYYYDYSDYGLEYGDTKVYETDDMYIAITTCDSEAEAKEEYETELDFLSDELVGFEPNVKTDVDGTNFDKATRYDSDLEAGILIIRVEDKVLAIISANEDGYNTSKELFDELGY